MRNEGGKPIEGLKLNSHICSARLYVGGTSIEEIQRKYSLAEIIKLASNENALGPSPLAVAAMQETLANTHRYPPVADGELRAKLAGTLGDGSLSAECFITGNGSCDVLSMVTRAFVCEEGDEVIICPPTFVIYEILVNICGGKCVCVDLKNDFTYDLPQVLASITDRTRLIFICNPNNPTGKYLTRQEIEAVLDACVDSLLVLDEAYISFINESWSSIDLMSRGNMVIVRSMTKDYALAGLRLGYVVASEEIIDNLRRVRPPWNVNVMAQKAGSAVLGDTDYLEQCERKIRQAKQFLTTELHQLGFTVVPSVSNFFLMRVGNAKAFRTALLRRGILVRDCTSLGLPEYVRIMPLTMKECKTLIATIQSLKHEGEPGAKV